VNFIASYHFIASSYFKAKGRKHPILHIGFEFLTVKIIKSSVFWDITLCGPFKVNLHFRGIYCLHFLARRVSSACCLLHAGFLLGSIFNPEDARDMFIQNDS
jgi:hypothetical protein